MEEQLRQIVEAVGKDEEVEAVYLFGSQATGRTKPYSDIDICILAKRDLKQSQKESILSHASKMIDLSLFYDLPQNIRYRVLRDGKLLFCRDANFLHDVRIQTVKSYLDFKPTLERHIKLTLGA